MTLRWGLGAAVLAAALWIGGAAAQVKVVASFSILGDMVGEIGGDAVRVVTLVGPNSDGHVYQPRPSDAREVSEAKLVVVNGLGFEGWLDRLIGAAGYGGPVVVASDGIAPLSVESSHGHGHGHDHGTARTGRRTTKPSKIADPHAWQNLANGQIYARNIGAGLAKADPANAARYAARADAYARRLAELDSFVKSEIGAIPAPRRKVITTHEAFAYFAKAYGVTFLAPLGVSTESEPSAGEVATLIRQIKKEGVKALFIENMTDKRLIDQIAREAGATLGGTLYSDALSARDGPAATYEQMFRHNVTQLKTGMLRN
jgi:zinc/manganese transport system substrate-binding protein